MTTAQDETTRASDRKLITVGIVGTIVAALCCFTPVLVVLLGTLGLSAVIGWLDFVLLPALAGFVALTVYAVWRRQRRPAKKEG